MRVYIFANQKGGVGKTTTAVNVAAAMADWGFRVLLVDIDPQSNATTSLGLDPRRTTPSSYELLLGEQPLSAIVRRTRWPRLELIPASPALAGATVTLHAIPDPRARLLRLREALTEVNGYDYLLLDAPPSLGLLTLNGLAAADGVIIPVQCEYLALEGLSQLMQTVTMVQRSVNPALALRGLVLTMYDRRTMLSRQVAEEVHRHFPRRLFPLVIPRSVRMSEAPSFGEPGIFYAPRSPAARAYRELTRLILIGDGVSPSRLPAQEGKEAG